MLKLWVLLFGCLVIVSVQAQHRPTGKPRDDCPHITCNHDCHGGFVQDIHRCQTCECKEHRPHEERPDDEEPGLVRCPRGLYCETDCPFGHNSVENGCPCKCRGFARRSRPDCPIWPRCAYRCEHGYKKSEQGCQTCECVPNCPMFKCMPCEHGYVSDVHGCQTCECDQKKTSTQMCEYRKSMMEKLRGEMEHRHPDLPAGIREHLAHPHAECNEDGTFTPMQCHATEGHCYCVDDRGIEMEGTRKAKEEHPGCEHQMTDGLTLSMVLAHNIDDVKTHMESIEKAVTEHMSEWMEMDPEFIDIMELLPHDVETHEMRIEIVIQHDQKSDLAYLAHKFQMENVENAHVIVCPEGGELTVDPKSIHVEHHQRPVAGHHDEKQDEENKHDEDYPSIAVCGRVWREHKPVVIVAGFGIAVFLCVIIAIIITIIRKRSMQDAQFKHAKMDKYRENLAYQNDMLGQSEKVKTVSVTITKSDEALA